MVDKIFHSAFKYSFNFLNRQIEIPSLVVDSQAAILEQYLSHSRHLADIRTRRSIRYAGLEADLMGLLEEVAEQVEASGNKEAGEILEQLTEEISRDAPRASLMKRSWAALTDMLPNIAKIAGAGATISKIFE